ncbi:MAG: GldG family protein [Saprospiraceae bacterium]|nr:GldG family protein [Saprospiraceae bacterium]MBP7801770.1 GldG family protein [Saprospiraceae bacterium]MBP8097311.1 GldG family protein [Saprospiraceae bacterium]
MKKNLTTILLISGILLIVNLLSRRYFIRLDLTKSGEFTLSKSTKNILRGLEDPITISAYFSKDLPANITKVRTDFKDLLVEYSNRSGGNINYEFINPNESETIEQEAMQAGIRPIMIDVREKDQSKQQKAYLGAVLKMGDRTEVLPFVQPGASMEYDLTTAIKKISNLNKQAIGLVQGYGAASMQELAQVNQALQALFIVEPVDLNNPIDPKFKTILFVRPKDTIQPIAFQNLDQFLERGGNMVAAVNAVDGDLQNAMGQVVFTGFPEWLATKGIHINNDLVIDSRCGQVNVQQQQGFFTMMTPVKFPYLPMAANFSTNPVTKGLEQVIFPFVSSVTVRDSSLRYISLVNSSEKSNTVPVPTMFDIQKQWTQTDFPKNNISMGGIVEKIGSPAWKMIVYGDGDFAVNGQEGRGMSPDNINLLVNSVDWMSDESGLMELRTKGATTHPIKEIDESQRSLIKYANFILPVLLVLLYGFIRSQQTKSARIRRMQERYV